MKLVHGELLWGKKKKDYWLLHNNLHYETDNLLALLCSVR